MLKQNGKLEYQLDLLDDIELENKEEKIKELNIKLQKVFLKCLKIRTENAKEKDEIINLICMIRYYNYLYIDEKSQIKDIKELKTYILEAENLLLKKAYELKALNKISSDEEANNSILRSIFTTKIINLENINIELKQNEQALEINMYDSDTFEKTVVIPKFNETTLLVKKAKKIKIIL